jgi:hypothetical protein
MKTPSSLVMMQTKTTTQCLEWQFLFKNFKTKILSIDSEMPLKSSCSTGKQTRMLGKQTSAQMNPLEASVEGPYKTNAAPNIWVFIPKKKTLVKQRSV